MQTDRFKSFDGAELAFHTLGEGPTVVLLHGFLSGAEANWFGPGIAQALADSGHRVVAPDLRGHGQSAAPTDLASWPRDVLATDQLALIEHLGLQRFDLVGYSLGARTAVRAMSRGLAPRRAALGGMGASGIMEAGARAEMFEDSIRHGEAAKDPRAGKRIQRMLAEGGLSAEAMLGVLASFQETTEDELRGIAVPTLVVCGRDDQDNGSPEELVALLPNATLRMVPGDHIGAVATPELKQAIVAHLS